MAPTSSKPQGGGVSTQKVGKQSDKPSKSVPGVKGTFGGRFRHGVGLYSMDLAFGSNKLGFGSGEHRYIGDTILLQMEDGTEKKASDVLLELQHGLKLTYGQINSLAGDFYGIAPISDGDDDATKRDLFVAAYNTLGLKNAKYDNVAEALEIIKNLQQELDLINKAIKDGIDPSEVYQLLPNDFVMLATFWNVTRGRGWGSGVPNYLTLLATNWDHFGERALAVYYAGHEVALQVAAAGFLMEAYQMNAFADHYLQDCFAAGHIRVPRRYLHGKMPTYLDPNNWMGALADDACAMYMHNEDNAVGIRVHNKMGENWMMYGDSRCFDHVAKENLERCRAATQASAHEIYMAFESQNVPERKSWAVEDHVCVLTDIEDLVAAPELQMLAPLFRLQDRDRNYVLKDSDPTYVCYVRADLDQRRAYDYDVSSSRVGTAAACFIDSRFGYPITLDPPCLAKTALTALPATEGDCVLFCQFPDRSVLEFDSVKDPERWEGGFFPCCEANLGSGLASLQWGTSTGLERRLYYADSSDYLAEASWNFQSLKWVTTGNGLGGKWFRMWPGKSQMAAGYTPAHKVISVWFISAKGGIANVMCNGGQWWLDNSGGDIPYADGSQLAVDFAEWNYSGDVETKIGLHCQGFYQQKDGMVRSFTADRFGGWTPKGALGHHKHAKSTLKQPPLRWVDPKTAIRAPFGTALATGLWQDVHEDPADPTKYRLAELFWQNARGCICTSICFEQDGEWRFEPEKELTGPVGCMTVGSEPYRTNLAFVRTGGVSRLFYQTSKERICELRKDAAGWKKFGSIW